MNKEPDNVVIFPKAHAHLGTPKSYEEIVTNLEVIKNLHVDETTQMVTSLLFEQLELAGFPLIYEEENIEDLALILEAIRSALNRQYSVEHPFQDFSRKIFLRREDGVVELIKENI